MWAIEHEPICHLFQMFASNMHQSEWFQIRFFNIYVDAWKRNKTGMEFVSLLICQGCLAVFQTLREVIQFRCSYQKFLIFV